jgi:hypothetical protein
MPRKPPPRRYKIGEAVIWTDYTDQTEHPCTILEHVEPEPDEDYDLAANGPLYSVRFNRSDRWDSQVAEVDLSPWPKPSLEVVGDRDDQDDQDET